ncbi:hypothetical protein pb186bvf_020001 [Paramecium bursaria]
MHRPATGSTNAGTTEDFYNMQFKQKKANDRYSQNQESQLHSDYQQKKCLIQQQIKENDNDGSGSTPPQHQDQSPRIKQQQSLDIYSESSWRNIEQISDSDIIEEYKINQPTKNIRPKNSKCSCFSIFSNSRPRQYKIDQDDQQRRAFLELTKIPFDPQKSYHKRIIYSILVNIDRDNINENHQKIVKDLKNMFQMYQMLSLTINFPDYIRKVFTLVPDCGCFINHLNDSISILLQNDQLKNIKFNDYINILRHVPMAIMLRTFEEKHPNYELSALLINHSKLIKDPARIQQFIEDFTQYLNNNYHPIHLQ